MVVRSCLRSMGQVSGSCVMWVGWVVCVSAKCVGLVGGLCVML